MRQQKVASPTDPPRVQPRGADLTLDRAGTDSEKQSRLFLKVLLHSHQKVRNLVQSTVTKGPTTHTAGAGHRTVRPLEQNLNLNLQLFIQSKTQNC